MGAVFHKRYSGRNLVWQIFGNAYVRRQKGVWGSNLVSGIGFVLKNVPMPSDPIFGHLAPPSLSDYWKSTENSSFEVAQKTRASVGEVKIWKN